MLLAHLENIDKLICIIQNLKVGFDIAYNNSFKADCKNLLVYSLHNSLYFLQCLVLPLVILIYLKKLIPSYRILKISCKSECSRPPEAEKDPEDI